MRVVQSHTVRTQRLLVLLAVQLQRLQVQVTGVLAGTRLSRPQVVLSEEGLARAAERAVGDGVALLERLPAHGTPLVELRASLETFPT